MILIPLDRGRFVVVYLCSAFSDRHQVMTPQKVQKTAKLGFFSLPEGGGINQSRQNLSHKCRSLVCSSTPNLAFIGKEGWSPPNVKICPKLQFFVPGR